MLACDAMLRRAVALPLLLYLGMGCLLLAGAFRRFDHLGRNDWNAFMGEAQAELTSLLDYGEWPQWNPWRKGGQVALAQPESMLFSPVTPVALFTGAVAAFKLWLLPLFVVGALGMHALAGLLGMRGVARVVPGAVFFGASVFPLYVTGGLPNWLFGMALLPWLLLAHRRAIEDFRFVALAALLYAGTLLCGSIHHFVFFPIALALDALCLAAARRTVRPLLTAGAALLVGALLAGVRLVPLLELYSQFPREVAGRSRSLPLDLVANVLLDPRIPDLASPGGGLLRHGGSVVYWINCGAFVGPIPLLLAAVGAIASWRRAAAPFVVGAAFLWMALGSGVTFSLWNLLHELPVLGSMKAPERMILLALFGLALLAGLGFEAAQRLATRLRRGQRLAVGLLLAAIVAPLLWVNAPITRDAFPIAPPEGLEPTTLLRPGSPRPPFQHAFLPAHPEQWGGPLYEAVLANVGSVDATSDVPSAASVRVAGDLGDRGAAWLEQGRGTITAEVGASSIRVRGRLTGDDLLIVNQTYFPGWSSSGSVTAPCSRHEDLIALALPAGEHDLVLRYAPASTALGVAASALAAAILLFWWRARRPAAALRPNNLARGDVLALAAVAAGLAAIGAWYAARAPGMAAGAPGFWPPRASRSADRPLQSRIDEARAGDVLGARGSVDEVGDLVLRRGIVLCADRPGLLAARTLRIEGLPSGEKLVVLGVRVGGESSGAATIRGCAGTVIVQDLGDRVDLEVVDSREVVVVGAWLRSLRATRSVVALVDARIEGDGSGPASEVTESTLLLTDTTIGAGPGGAAVRLSRSRLVASARPTQAGKPDLVLRDGSLARLSGIELSPQATEVDAGSTLERCDPPLPRIELVGELTPGARVKLHLFGPPGATGVLRLSRRPRLAAISEIGAPAAIDPDDLVELVVAELVKFPESGELVREASASLIPPLAGSGWYVQLVVVEAGGRERASTPFARLVVPPRARRKE